MSNSKYITKSGNIYTFSYEQFAEDIPAGTYFPTLDNNDRFGLFVARNEQRSPRMNTNGEEGVENEYADFINEKDDENRGEGDVHHQYGAEAHQADNAAGNGGDNANGMQRTSNGRLTLRYMDQNYFPMEKYVEPFTELTKIIDAFIANRAFYRQKRLDYKRSVLLYGDPGVGKTRFLANLADNLIVEKDAIVIRIESRKHLDRYAAGIPALNDFCGDRLKVVVIEELSELLRGRTADPDILNMLDSTLLKDDIIYLITTNYPEKIPTNIIDRPSRVDDIIGVHQEHFNEKFICGWYEHLMGEPVPEKDIESGFIGKMAGKYSPAYLKELFLKSYMKADSLEEVLTEIDNRRRQIRKAFRQKQEVGFM